MAPGVVLGADEVHFVSIGNVSPLSEVQNIWSALGKAASWGDARIRILWQLRKQTKDTKDMIRINLDIIPILCPLCLQ